MKKAIWFLLALGALSLLFLQLFHENGVWFSHFPWRLHSDVIYAGEIFQDFWQDGFPLGEWNFQGYPFLFPDLVFFLVSGIFTTKVGWIYSAWVLFLMSSLVTLFSTCLKPTGLSLPCRIFLSALAWGLVFNSYPAHDVWEYRPDNLFMYTFLVPVLHSGSHLIGFSIFSIALMGIHQGLSRNLRLFFFTVTFLGNFSDVIYIPQYLFPVLLLFFWKDEVLLSAWWLAFKRCFQPSQRSSLKNHFQGFWREQTSEGRELLLLSLYSFLIARGIGLFLRLTDILHMESMPALGLGSPGKFPRRMSIMAGDFFMYFKNNPMFFAGFLFMLALPLLLWGLRKSGKARLFSKKSPWSRIQFLLMAGWFCTLLAVTLTGRWERGKIRYIHPMFFIPQLILMLHLGAFLFKTLNKTWISIGVGALLLFLVFLPGSSRFHEAPFHLGNPSLPYPGYMNCLDDLKNKGILKKGVSGYWTRGPVNFYTRSRLITLQVQHSWKSFEWLNNRAWAKGPEPFNFILTPGLHTGMAENRLGEPDAIYDCPPLQAHVYEGEKERELTRWANSLQNSHSP